MTFGQVIFALDSTFPVLCDYDYFPGEPFEKIPWFITAFSSGSLLTLVPVIELDWFGAQNIGLVHGTTMLGAIIGQVTLFNILGSFMELGAINYLATALCGGCIYLAFRMHLASSDLGKKATTASSENASGSRPSNESNGDSERKPLLEGEV
eukprot:CAMPEP_0205907060 /NCGR_PEP_ID=MMETSP1325-20131115/2300_1 /ASSEMBLY_ACC=CAM_ASM_000708 /TAXON_ID=236786 /ORGANISM="Florenciella sp., Strain RCC1007" /LENGTH=151 /DNA_ID=CAMNT_0053273117 /DNA_START=58 /DNA_END=513 /DNA_ORIENTATION=-